MRTTHRPQPRPRTPGRRSPSRAVALRKEIAETARAMGAPSFGVADVRSLLARVPGLLALLPTDLPRAVVCGVRLPDAVVDQLVDRPAPIYLHVYRQANYLLDRIGWHVADQLQTAGYSALAVPASQIVAQDPMRGQVSHRMLGYAAGLGHIGRCRLLVNPRFGARMRYVSVFTDAPLEPDKPAEADCGSCRACVQDCPAHAVHERSEDFDVGACYRQLTEFSRLPFIGQHVCGLCVKACRGRRETSTSAK